MKKLLKIILSSFVVATVFSTALFAEEDYSNINLYASKFENEYEKILREQRKEEERIARKQEKREQKLRRYRPFDQSLGYGSMTDFRSGLGFYFAMRQINDTYTPIINPDQGCFNAFQIDLGLGPGFFVYGHVYGLTGPFQLFLYDKNTTNIAFSYGGGIGFNKRIMFGRYPDNIYVLGGVNYYPYDWFINGREVYGETYFYHTSVGLDLQLSRHWAINIADNFDYVPECEGYSYYLNTLSLGLALTFPN